MMLRIKRVPTVVSNYQKEDSDEGCGRNCLRSCCLPGAKLPLYAFKKESNSNVVVETNSVAIDEKNELQPDFLDSLLIGEWEERMQRGLFRYDENKELQPDFLVCFATFGGAATGTDVLSSTISGSTSSGKTTSGKSSSKVSGEDFSESSFKSTLDPKILRTASLVSTDRTPSARSLPKISFQSFNINFRQRSSFDLVTSGVAGCSVLTRG